MTRRLIGQGWLAPDHNLVHPTCYNPDRGAHVKHEMELLCHTAGVFSHLGIDQGALSQKRPLPAAAASV
ncbi:MAG: hypothetical protein P8X96_17835 [Desulfobacteraceae bacterium]|jgi:hypothetical protein